MDPIATAQYGLLAASRRFEASASRVARMGVEGENVDLAAVQHACDAEFGTGTLAVLALPDARWGAKVVALSRADLDLGEFLFDVGGQCHAGFLLPTRDRGRGA